MTAPLVSFRAGGRRGYGLWSGGGVVDLTPRFLDWPTLKAAIAGGGVARLVDAGQGRAPDLGPGDFTYDIPVPDAEKILCVGVNYPARNEEYRDGQDAPPYPSLFPRFARSFVGHEGALTRPRASQKLDYEGEVVLVIGKAGRHIARADALSHITGISLCNEGTIRDWVRHAKFNVTQGKNFDGSGAIGPGMVPFTDEAQIADIRLTTRVNGEVRQDDRTSRMIFDFRYLLHYISTFTTLMPGDMIVTGTPVGAGARLDPPRWLRPGDVVEVEAEGIGLLRNGVQDE